jgi:hypothetical protein
LHIILIVNIKLEFNELKKNVDRENMAYSIGYKKRAGEYKDAGHTSGELREAFQIPPLTCYGWKEKLQNGCFEKKFSRQRKRKTDREN